MSDKQQPQTAAASKASSEKSEAAKTNASAENKAVKIRLAKRLNQTKEAKFEQQPAQVTASAPHGATQEQAASSVGTEEVLQPGIENKPLQVKQQNLRRKPKLKKLWLLSKIPLLKVKQ